MKYAPPLLLVAALAGCQAPAPGHVSTDVVELYDIALPSGMLEFEYDRDGNLIEAEADIDPRDLPRAVLEAAENAYPGIRVTGAEREVQGEARVWEVKFVHEGRAMELVIDGAGIVRETERELLESEVPPPVLEAAAATIAGSKFKSVERLVSDQGVTYHVKRTRDGATYKVVLDGDGTILRRVREARAEIEIPLRD